MKQSILIIASTLLVYSFTGCKPGKDDSAVTTGTDSSLITTTTTTGTGEPATARPDSITNPSASTTDTASMAKPDPSKKGKKGKVSLSMETPKATGSEDAMDKEGYYTNVYPAYPGGNNALASYFEKNIKYPQDAADNGVEGTVNITFTVDEKGKVASPKVTSSKLGYGLEEEALRVFNKMPSWTPGALKGKNVKTRYTLPVRFQLEG